MGVQHIDMANYHPFAPNGWTGIHQGAAIVFFAYIGFDSISTAAEETKDPQRNDAASASWAGSLICTIIYVIVGAVLTGMVPYQKLGWHDPLATALNQAGLHELQLRSSALGAVFSMSAVLLVFQYGQPRIFYGDGARRPAAPVGGEHPSRSTRVPHVTTIITGVFVALWALIGDAGETYDLTNIGTLFAFVLVCIGVLVLRHTDPDRPRPFRVPFVYPVAVTGAIVCIITMWGLPESAKIRFIVWLVIGLVMYFAYGYRNSTLRNRAAPPPTPELHVRRNPHFGGADASEDWPAPHHTNAVDRDLHDRWRAGRAFLPGTRRTGFEATDLQLLSTVFLRMIKSLIVPLLFSTLVVGIAGHGDDMKRVGKLAFRSILYFEIVTTLALVVGLVTVNVLKPGRGVNLSSASVEAGAELSKTHTTFSDVIIHAVPQSVFEAPLCILLFARALIASRRHRC